MSTTLSSINGARGPFLISKFMTDTRTSIVEAATRTVAKHGARKTAMVDIAQAAGVSRQTLYALFGSKDELVAETINHNARINFAEVEEGLRGCSSLEEELEVYFTKTIVRSFELIQGSEDLEDIMSGHSEAGRAALAVLEKQHKKLVSRLLAPYNKQIEASGQSANQLAHFCVTCARGFKYSAKSRRDLNVLLKALKTSVLLASNYTISRDPESAKRAAPF